VELRNSLSQASGLRLPNTLVFDQPSAVALASYIRERLAGDRAPVADGAAARDGGGTLTTLLRQAHARGAIMDAVPLLVEASKLRPAFSSADDLDEPPRPARISDLGAPPKLICIPSFLVGTGPHQFARFGAGFRGSRPVSAVPLPGFRPGELVPATWRAAVDSLAASVRLVADGEPFALVGFSIGGALAHAGAETLEDEGEGPAAVILIDTYAPEGDAMSATLSSVMGQILDRADERVSVDDDMLIVIGAYTRMYSEWAPGSIQAPRLLIRSSRPLGEPAGLPDWQLPDDIVEVEGDHWALIEDAAADTANAADAWLTQKVAVPTTP
jgi:hypothetical protein